MKLQNKIITIIIFSIFFCSFGRKETTNKIINFEEIKQFSKLLYETGSLFDFEKLNNLFLNERSHLILQEEHKNVEGNLITGETNYVFKNEKKDYENIKDLLLSFGKVKSYNILDYRFEESIYDVAESNLYYILYNVEYENFTTTEYFWLKKNNDNIYVYRYSVNFSAKE